MRRLGGGWRGLWGIMSRGEVVDCTVIIDTHEALMGMHLNHPYSVKHCQYYLHRFHGTWI